MAMTADLTLAGLVDYRPDVFDNLVLPSPPLDAAAIGLQADQLRAAWTIDREDFINYLCFRSMGMCIAVPDAEFFKAAVGVWSRTHIHEWQMMFDSVFFKYNPLWNKDGKVTETGTDEHEGEETETNEGESDGNNVNTGYTHGYDGGTTHVDDELDWTHSDKQTGKVHAETQNTRTNNNNNTLEFEHVTLEQGNIGVTKSTELIDDFRKTAMFSIEDMIADEFQKNFLLMVW